MFLGNEGDHGPGVSLRTERKESDGYWCIHVKLTTLAVGRALQLTSIVLLSAKERRQGAGWCVCVCVCACVCVCECMHVHMYECRESPPYPEVWHQLQAGHGPKALRSKGWLKQAYLEELLTTHIYL